MATNNLRERRKARQTFAKLPTNIRLGFVAQYAGIGANERFIGLCCAHCGYWDNLGHDSSCPVGKQIREDKAYARNQKAKQPS